MSLLWSELRLHWVSVLTWAVSVALLVLLIVSIYPTVKDNPDLNSIYEGMPANAQALLGGTDLTSPVGYLNTQMFAFFLPAVLLIFGISRGAAAIAGEEEDRTLDLLLAQPVTRTAAYLQKALFVGVGVFALTLASWLPIVALNSAVGLNLPVANVAAVCLQMGLLVLALAMASQAIAAATGRRMWGTAAVGAYAFVSYLVYGLAATVSWLEPLKPLTVWRWYLENQPLSTGFGWAESVVMAVVALVAAGLGTYAFQRRDLRS